MQRRYRIIAVELSPEYDGDDEHIELLNEGATNIHQYNYTEEESYEGQHFDYCAIMLHRINARIRSL